MPEQSLVRRQRRLGAHLPPPPLDALEQRRFFAADIGAGADAGFPARRPSRQAGGTRNDDGLLHGPDRIGIFGADVDVALAGADRVARDRHAFDHRERIAFHQHPVGVGARVALVGVADDVLAVCRGVGCRLPLYACRKSCAAAATQPGGRHFLDCAGRPQVARTRQPAIAAMGAVVVEREWIDDAAPGEGDPRLALQEGDLLGPADAQGVSGALHQSGFEQGRHIGGLHRAIGDAPCRRLDLDHRLQPEETARAGADQRHVQLAPAGFGPQRVGHAVGADRACRRIAWHEDSRRHRSTSPAMSSSAA